MNIKIFTFFSVAISALFIQCQQAPDDSKVDFSNYHKENKVLAQYYRWFLTFERSYNDQRLANHMQLMTDDLDLNAVGGQINGKQHLLDFMDYIKDWQNSHQVKNAKVSIGSNDTLLLLADILYQNILPDSSRTNHNFRYSAKLLDPKDGLPLFSKITVTEDTTYQIKQPYKDLYWENRSKAFIYYWIHLMDHLNGNESKFDELLAENFDLEFIDTSINNSADFKAWITETKSQIASSLHIPKNIDAWLDKDNAIRVSFDVDWHGLTIDGDKLFAQIHHDWILESELDEPYARLKEIKIDQTIPIRKVQEFNLLN